MIGVDTSFLIDFEIAEHPLCKSARTLAQHYASSCFAITPQVLTEFIHVVTDPRIFVQPLSMGEALKRSNRWWNAREVLQVFPSSRSVSLFHQWLTKHNLGIKRLLDTMLAAIYVENEIAKIISTDARDFNLFKPLQIVNIPASLA